MEKEIHTVGLGHVRKVAPRNRASKAMKILKEYVERHSGVENVSVSNSVNEYLWSNGARNPPKSVEVQVLVEDSTAHIELADMDFELEEEEEEVEEIVEELSDEELAERNVDEVKELVDSGAVETQRALDVEYAGKNRKTLIEWLRDRVGAEEEDTDKVEETPEPEEIEEETEEGAGEEVEEKEPEEKEETYDLPDKTVEIFREGNIGEGKEAAKELGKSEFEKLLNFEEAHQNRKGMKKFLRSNMN